MSAPNKSYDPVEVEALKPEEIERMRDEALAAFAAADSLDALHEAKIAHTGPASPLALANREIGALPPHAKADAGKRVGQARGAVNKALAGRQSELEAERDARVLVEEAVDVTLPHDRVPSGARHPLTTLSERIEDIFVAMGYEVAEGPQVEAEWFNFDALNIGPDHPARGEHDTFFVQGPQGGTESGVVLRTHTSPVQIRSLLGRELPVYVICPGRVYRTDELDATHTPVFHQVELLAVDEGLTMADLKGTLDHMVQSLFGGAYVEAPNYPFVGEQIFDQLGLDADDPARRVVKLTNPLNDEEPVLRTSLLPGLLGALRRNDGRGSHDVALFETGLVFKPREEQRAAVRLPVDRRPTDEELAGLDAALPDQPRHVAAVLAGAREQAGWWGAGRPADWADAIEAARTVAAEAGAELVVRQGRYGPWHPGRCAELAVTVDGTERVVGHAGELHPRVVKNLGLPARTCAMELDLDALEQAGESIPQAPGISTFPVATQDVALVVDGSVPAADVEAALREGAGELLESIRLFDVYENAEQLGEGRKSLAYALRFRAPDRTLTVDEASAARESAVALAGERTGATLRG
ncbi:hypothetical protein SHIRM173S_11486 [Streptomyces hirsutus]